ncbi:SDR family NAD(P)-dependent oxidoreductase [Pseudomonas sp. H11T01]|uniref:SDR family NAD(P)-dependent oxidoreductase n=1 Tax=Pseudomonas sp. H11T01 TaxID=3402749 RepID=UPI003AD4F482
MNLQLEGKRALVTGASSGIGASIAEHLAAEGAKVIVHGRNEERARAIVTRIRNAGGEAEIALGDLCTDEGAVAVSTNANAHWGGIDILVNNAGGPSQPGATWSDATMDDWQRTYDLNVFSTVRMIQLCLTGMKQQKWGRIIQISSMATFKPEANIPDYSSMKACLPVLSVSLAKELTGTGITVNCLAAGLVVTRVLHDYFMALPENSRKTWEEVEPGIASDWGSLVGRLGTPADIASLVTFLASPLAGYINGTNVLIDGGMAGINR